MLSLDHIAGREIPRVNRRLRREGRALRTSASIFTHGITHCVKIKNAPKGSAHGALTHSRSEVHKIHYILLTGVFLCLKFIFSLTLSASAISECGYLLRRQSLNPVEQSAVVAVRAV